MYVLDEKKEDKDKPKRKKKAIDYSTVDVEAAREAAARRRPGGVD